GCAFDELGRLGPHAREALSMLVAAGARAGAGHPADLAAELYATIGVTHVRANAWRLARYAHVNRDRSRNAPPLAAVDPRGLRWAGGAMGSLARGGGLGEGSGRGIVVTCP